MQPVDSLQEILEVSAALIAASVALRARAARLRDELVAARHTTLHARLESQEWRLQYTTSCPPLEGGKTTIKWLRYTISSVT
jgi:hypothetical protein